ncbi:MAG: hypothetical protein E6Q99_10395, partial [Elusimicrobia bacterium]
RILHSGTQRQGSRLLTAGGRVMTAVALADDADTARRYAYHAADAVHFAGQQRRSDIGQPPAAAARRSQIHAHDRNPHVAGGTDG